MQEISLITSPEVSEMGLGGIFTYSIERDGKIIEKWEDHNIVVDQGLQYAISAALAGGSVSTSWFIGLYKNNFTPIASNVMATFVGAGVANEATTEYSEATRPAWTYGALSGNALSNSASPALFTFTASSTVINGAFLTNSSTKGGTTGILLSANKFTSARTLLASDTLSVAYTITSSSS